MTTIHRRDLKTQLALLLGDAVGAAEAYAIATKGKQADNLFATAKAMVSFSPELAAHYDVFRESLYLCATGSTFQPLTGTARGKDGFKTTYLFGDEVHEWASDELYSIVREGVASRREPLEFLISTAGVHHGYGVRLWEESVKICEGAYDDPETLVAIWCAPQDPEVEIDIQDPTVWHEANPNLGKSKRYDFMVKAAREAAQDTAAENTFKRKHLNIWVGQNERWLPMPFWHACNYGDPDRWKDIARDMRGRKCWGGLDLASTRDFCALVWVFPPEGDERHYTVLPRLWWHALPHRPRHRRMRALQQRGDARPAAGAEPAHRRARGAAARGRRGDPRQDQHGRVRDGLLQRELPRRPHPQPLGHHQGARRLVGRLGRRGGRGRERAGEGRAGQRHGRCRRCRRGGQATQESTKSAEGHNR